MWAVVHSKATSFLAIHDYRAGQGDVPAVGGYLQLQFVVNGVLLFPRKWHVCLGLLLASVDPVADRHRGAAATDLHCRRADRLAGWRH